MGGKMKTLVFIATEWGAKNGGINSFNYDLVSSIHSNSKEKIQTVCVVKSATLQEIHDANLKGVTLYETKENKFNAANITQIINENNHNVICWIGHDIITGAEANECCNIFRSLLNINCSSAVIHHMDYSSYYTSKTNDSLKTFEKIEMQKDIFNECDIVFAVGPFLKNSVTNLLKEIDNDNEVIELIPGLADITNVDIDNPFKVISYGRLGEYDEVVKQGKLAVAAYSKMCKSETVNNSQLTLIGLDKENIIKSQKELYEIGFEYAGKLCNINGLPYSDRELIYNQLKTQSASMLLSTHEGFGLTGWEAISAEVPLIVSIDTGLYKYIDEKLGGAGIGCLYPVKIVGKLEEDLTPVSQELIKIKQNTDKARKNAKNLKQQLKEMTWENTADMLISQILLMTNLLNKNPKEISNYNLEESRTTDLKDLKVTHSHKVIHSNSNLKYPLFYSTSTLIANIIAERYYDDLHYVWCTSTFNPVKSNPPSANPYQIYKSILKEVENGEIGPSIQKHKTGLLNGVSKSKDKGKITHEQQNEIYEMIFAAEIKHFKPIIYVIPGMHVGNIEMVPRSKRSDLLSEEFLIEELKGKWLDVIDLE